MEKQDQEHKERKKGHTYVQWLASITVNLVTLNYGLQAAWLSPNIKTLQSPNSPTGSPLSDSEISWVGSTQSLVAAVGVLIISILVDKYGRKFCIFLTAALQAMAWCTKLSSASTIVIIISRVLSGISAGAVCVVVPMYVREMSEEHIRGRLGSLMAMFHTGGFFIIYAIGAYLDYFTMLWVVFWLPLLCILLMIRVPESPAFLVKSGKNEEAALALAFLRGLDQKDEAIQKVIDYMKKEDLYFKSLPKISFLSILKDKAWRSIFLRMLALMTVHASNGSFSLVTYASTILSSSTGSSPLRPELQSLSFPLIMIPAAFASMICVEKFGRKPVLILGISISVMSMICVASVVLVQLQGGAVSYWIPLIAMIVNVASYAFSLSPVPFILMSEMFNFQIRAKAMGPIVSYSWIFTFFQLLLFDPLSKAIGLAGVFYYFAVVNALGLFITVVFLIETKGKSTEQIENEMREK